jgi:hypothetical protein
MLKNSNEKLGSAMPFFKKLLGSNKANRKPLQIATNKQDRQQATSEPNYLYERKATLILNSACKKLQGIAMSANFVWKKLQCAPISEALILKLLKQGMNKHKQRRSTQNPNLSQNKVSKVNPNLVY